MGLITGILIGTGAIAAGIAAVTDERESPTIAPTPNRRRTKEDYLGTSFSVKYPVSTPVTPTTPMVKTTGTTAYTTQTTSAPSTPDVKNINPYGTTRTFSKEPEFNYYNDPYQVNSMADVLLNKKGKDLVLKDLKAEWATHIPVLQELIVATDYLKRSYLDPFEKTKGLDGVKSAFLQAGANALYATGENMDIIANPVKGLIIDGPKGLIQGFGGGDTGRTQYDYNANTGNKAFDFVVNMAAEIVSDPTNLVQLGTSEFIQQGISNVLDRTARTTASEIGEDVVKESVESLTDKYNKSISKQLAFQYADKGKVNITDILKNTEGVLRTSGASEQAVELFYRNASDAVDIINASNIFNSIYKIGNVADSVDKFLIKTSPLGLGLSAAGKLVGNKTGTMLTWIKNAYTKKFYQDAVTPANIMDAVTFSKISNRIETYHKVRVGSMYDKVISSVDKTIGAIDSGKLNNTIDFNTLSKLYRKYDLVSKSTTDNMVEYLDNLLLDGQITKETYTFLKADPNFVPYYNSIVEDATLKNTLRRTMYDSDVTKARVSEIIKGSNTTYDAVINIVDMFNNTLGYQEQITTPADFDKYITSKITQANKRIKITQEKIKLLPAGTSPKKLTEQLDLLDIQVRELSSIKSLFDNVISDLGIDITSIPDPAILKEILELDIKDPKEITKYINTKKATLKNELTNLASNINRKTAEQKQLEKNIKTNKYAAESKIRLRELNEDLIENKRTYLILKREANNYDAVKKYLATPSLSKTVEPADIVVALAKLNDPDFIEANTNLLKTVASDTSDIDLYFKVNEDGTPVYDKRYVTDASRAETKEAIDTQRLIVADDVDKFMRDIEDEYSIDPVQPHTTADIVRLKKENAKLSDNWEVINKDYTIIDTVENFDLRDKAYKKQLANNPDKSYKDLTGKTEEQMLDEYLKAFNEYDKFSYDHIKQTKSDYVEGERILQNIDSHNYNKQIPGLSMSIDRELDLTDLDPRTKEAYLLLSDNKLATNKDIEQAMEILNELDPDKYDIPKYHDSLISTLFVSNDPIKYKIQTQQLQVHKELIDRLASNPATHQLVYDLANDTNDSVVGSVLNSILNKSNSLSSESISFSLDSIKRLKETAKAHVAYEQLMVNALNKLQGSDSKIGVAFLDYISGLNMKDKTTMIDKLMPDGVLDLKLLRDMVDMRYNGNTGMYALKNSDLARYFGFDVDATKLHNSKYDTEVGMFVQSKLIDEGVLPKPKDGQIYTYFDFETTGLGDKIPDQVVQVTAVKYRWNGDSFEIIDTLDEYASLNRGYTFDKSTLQTPENPDGIFDKEFINNVKYHGIQEKQVLKDFNTFAEGTLVGHNIERFDIPFYEKRAGAPLVDFRKVTDVQDTYVAARKMFGAKEIDNDTINKLGVYLQQYIDSIQELNTTKFITLFDRDSADSLFNIGKDIADITLNNKNVNTLLERIDANNYERAFEGLLGKTDLTSINKELKPRPNELQDVVKGCDINSDESLIQQVRDILTAVKDSNKVMSEYVITKEMLEDYSEEVLREKNLAFDYKIKLNAFGIVNGAYIDEAGKVRINPEYHLGQWGTHKLKPTYEDSVTKLIKQDITEPLAIRESLVAAVETIDSPNADIAAKVQAFDTLGANGSNYVQASRIKAALNDYTNNATNELNLDDRIKSVMANGNTEVRTDMDLAIDYTNKIQTMSSKEYKELNNKVCVADVYSKLDPDRTPQQITAHITDKSGGLGVITDINNKEYSELVKRIKQQEAEFEALGYTLKQDGDTLYILATDRDKVIANSQAVAGEYNIKHHQYDYADKEQAIFDSAQTIHNRFNAIRGTSNATTTPYDFASNLSYADTFYASSRIHGDIYKDTLLEDPDWIERYYTTRTPRYTEGIVGSLKGQRSFNSMYTMPLNHNVNLIDKSIRRVDGRNKFIQLYFNNDLSINGKFFNDLSDQELFDAYKTKSQDNVFLILVEDKKSGKPYVRTIKPNSVKDMPYLRHMNAVLTPQYNANSIIRTINKDVFDNKFKIPIVQFYYKYIISTYKSLYLTSVGMLARNFVDIMVKNTVEGTPEQIPETLLSFIKASKDWNWYEKVTREIKDNYRTINSQTIDLYLKRLANGDANKLIEYNNLFKELHEYATSSVSAGMSAAQEEMLCQFYNKYGSRTALKDYEWYMDGVTPNKFDEWFFQDNALREVNQKAMDINNIIEHSGRISNLRLGLAKGMSESDAYSRVLRTHFDYGMKSKAQMYAELIFPFVTFPIYNLQYWTDAIYKSPWLMEMLLDQSRSSLDIEQQKQFTLDNSQALQAAFLNGNVKIGDTLFKLNPSLMDAFQITATPLETIDQRLVAPIKFGVKALTEKDYIKNRYVNESVTNLDKFKNAIDDAGLYPVRRPIETVAKLATKGVTGLESFVPSLATRRVQNYGAKIGENFDQVKIKTGSGTRYFTTRSKDGSVVSNKYYPKISTTAGRSYTRIPSAGRYYSGSYNIYNRWKANRITPYALSKLGSPESLQYAFKGLAYKFGINIDSRRKLRLYQLKQNNMYRTK